MGYFITGATGFIGRFLLARLVQRSGTLYCLVRSDTAEAKLRVQAERLGLTERLVPIRGDLTQPGLGLSDADRERLTGEVQHFFHLAALYDLGASAEAQQAANVAGTRHALEAAEALQPKCFHHISSIAAAGLYPGTFSEDMFDQATGLDHPYFLTKHLSEKAVREQCPVPFRIYRPGIVIGDTVHGEADKPDGPYYFFKLIQTLRDNLPRWVPLLGLEGGRLNIVPVDFVAQAMDHLAHLPDQDGQCFHLTDPAPLRAGEVLNLFADAGHAPRMVLRFNTRLINLVPAPILEQIRQFPPMRQIGHGLLKEYGLPSTVLDLLNYPTRFDNQATRDLLAPAGIHCPSLASYAPQIWDYWERNLDPALHVEQQLERRLKNKVVLLTGAASGIGMATTLKLAPRGATLLLVDRDPEGLASVVDQVKALGGKAWGYPADLTDTAAVQAMLEAIHAEHERVDILVNNAGHSIRRAVTDAKDRLHDFERTMAINYFAAIQLILGTLGGMEQRHRGHVINISSIGVLTNAPRFSAYVASKAALDAFSRCAASEYSDVGIRFTTINMPLVRTPMIAPTKAYDNVPTLTPEQAADLVLEAILHRPKRLATKLGIFGATLHAVAPNLAEVVANASFRLFGEAKSNEPSSNQAQQQRLTVAALLRGIHF